MTRDQKAAYAKSPTWHFLGEVRPTRGGLSGGLKQKLAAIARRVAAKRKRRAK